MIGSLALAGALYMIVTDLRATWRPMPTITVPDVPHDTLCYKQKLDPPGAMGRCDRPKGHLGPHSYALADCLRDLRVLLATWDVSARPTDWQRADELRTAVAPYQAMLEP